jgi:hypothetical protein
VDFQDAILELGLHLTGVHFGRQREPAQEPAAFAFDLVEPLPLLLFLLANGRAAKEGDRLRRGSRWAVGVALSPIAYPQRASHPLRSAGQAGAFSHNALTHA